MKALIFTHHPEEGPGLLGDILRARGWEMSEDVPSSTFCYFNRKSLERNFGAKNEKIDHGA